MGIRKIEINFPIEIELPPGWDQALDGLVTILCKSYEMQHPAQCMWAAGYGSKLIWNEPHEPTFDHSIYTIEVVERPANKRELQRRKKLGEQ